MWLLWIEGWRFWSLEIIMPLLWVCMILKRMRCHFYSPHLYCCSGIGCSCQFGKCLPAAGDCGGKTLLNRMISSMSWVAKFEENSMLFFRFVDDTSLDLLWEVDPMSIFDFLVGAFSVCLLRAWFVRRNQGGMIKIIAMIRVPPANQIIHRELQPFIYAVSYVKIKILLVFCS